MFVGLGQVRALLDSGIGIGCNPGEADLDAGDMTLSIVRAAARPPRARVFVDGAPGLPGAMRLGCEGAHLTDVREDIATVSQLGLSSPPSARPSRSTLTGRR